MGEKEKAGAERSVGLGQVTEIVTREAQPDQAQSKVVEQTNTGVKSAMQTQV